MKTRKFGLFVCLMAILLAVFPACADGGTTPAATTPGAPAATTPGAPAPTAQGEIVEWKFASFSGTADPGWEWDMYISNKVAELTGGRFKIKIFPAGQLCPVYEILDNIVSGSIQMGMGLKPGDDRFVYMSHALYMNPADFMYWYYGGGGKAVVDELYASMNQKQFLYQIGTTESGMRGNVPVTKKEAYAGKKVRTYMTVYMDFLKEWGATSMTVAGGELYETVQRGIVDLFEYGDPVSDWTFGFQEIAKYWTVPAWYQSFTAMSMGINLDAWNKLPKEYQTALETAAGLCVNVSWAKKELQAAEYTQKFIDYGTIIEQCTPEFYQEALPVMKKIYETRAQGNAWFAKVMKSQFDYLKKMKVWKKAAQPFEPGFILEDAQYPDIKAEWTVIKK